MSRVTMLYDSWQHRHEWPVVANIMHTKPPWNSYGYESALPHRFYPRQMNARVTLAEQADQDLVAHPSIGQWHDLQLRDALL